jgi:hypothetical protein
VVVVVVVNNVHTDFYEIRQKLSERNIHIDMLQTAFP